MGIGIATSLWWMYFDNASGVVVRRSSKIERTWRPTTWIYTHLLLAAALAALGVGLEAAVSAAGAGPMGSTARWLLVGSTAVALGAMALIQHASVGVAGDLMNRAITINRLVGLSVVLGLGFLTSFEAHWVTLGVLGVCSAEVIADLRANDDFGPVQAPLEFEGDQTGLAGDS
jgi:low temperature requirement protein LtrA